MDSQKTDTTILIKGLKTMGISLILMFLGPSLFYVAESNPDKPLYIPLLILSILICFSAIFIAFKGLSTIMKSMFK